MEGKNPSVFEGDDRPVDTVSWDDAQEFIQKLNAATDQKYRLPTEAEWEFAARGGKYSGSYQYAGSDAIEEVAWYGYYSSNGNQHGETKPVDLKYPNELGIYDMSGNVWEWCQDWYGDLPTYAQVNPKGPIDGNYRIGRGGSWSGRDSIFCSVWYRDFYLADGRDNFHCFRLAL